MRENLLALEVKGLSVYCGVNRIVLPRKTRDGVHQVVNRVHTRGSSYTSRELTSAWLAVLTPTQGQEDQREESWERRSEDIEISD